MTKKRETTQTDTVAAKRQIPSFQFSVDIGDFSVLKVIFSDLEYNDNELWKHIEKMVTIQEGTDR
eukprot:CAMPEP_0116123510 /NCGR_PEP_ID=MMETSP0329-20121206/4788_1 /TAXON_ID=697910 /ORGANISM="Pseudo-nitzschia arenysensis, Strain B593" /LENGTH=64 /DNA_ID=CAMNT_0003617433 /DNA_START=1270 /DNA_END=1460 /DNA_ORIENTATION=+